MSEEKSDTPVSDSVVIRYPGDLRLAVGNQTYTGVRFHVFDTDEQLNAWATENKSAGVIGVDFRVNERGQIVLAFTTTLNERQQRFLTTQAHVIKKMTEEAFAEEERLEEVNRRAQKAAEAEQERLAGVGAKYEADQRRLKEAQPKKVKK